MTLEEQLWRDGPDNPDNHYEPHEGPETPPRFDLPVQLETRGITEQVTEADREQFPTWHQQLIWSSGTIHKNTIAAKLRSIGETAHAETLEKCHTIYTVAQCNKCHTVKKFPNRCDNFFCPECQPRRSNDRKRAVEWWARTISQPKFVTLTVKNLPDLTQAHVAEFKKWWKNLRNRVFTNNWRGGFYSIEVTNEGKGWHLHLHALIDAVFIDQFALSENWNSVTNGMGRIVKVKDARQIDYLKETTKYTVKGVMLAAWTPEQIKTFIDAFSGPRTFGVFGTLYGKRTEFAEWFKAVRDSKPKCDCGCSAINYFSEAEFLEKDFVPAIGEQAIPPPRPIEHPEFQNFLATQFPY